MKSLTILLALATMLASCATNKSQSDLDKLTVFLNNGDLFIGTGNVNLHLNLITVFDSLGNRKTFTASEVDSAVITTTVFVGIGNRFFKPLFNGESITVFERKYDEIVGNNTTITHKKEHTILAFERGYDRKLELKENVINFYEYQKLFRFTRRCVERSDNIHFEDIIDLLKQYDKCSKKINNRTIPRNTLEIIADIDTMAKK